MTVEKPKPKQLLRPITTGAGSAMNQSQFLAITCNSLEAQEKSRVHGAIGFGFASHWLKNWRESFKPITKRSNHNHVIIFDSHLKTALSALSNFFLHYVLSTELRQLWLLFLLLLLCNEMIIISASQWRLKVCHPLTIEPAHEQTNPHLPVFYF